MRCARRSTAAETALGSSSELAMALAPRHEELRRNRLHNIGPTGLVFNWADSSACGDASGTGCHFVSALAVTSSFTAFNTS